MSKRSYESAKALDIFEKFSSENSLQNILSRYQELLDILGLEPGIYPEYFPIIKENLYSKECQELLSRYEKRVANKSYSNGQICKNQKVLIVGAGPSGLRTAIECQLLGAKVVVIESRTEFTRANVLHLWPFVITDLKDLGAKKFYGKFCSGSIDHISICQLQCMLLKIALLLGVEFHSGISFREYFYDPQKSNWVISTEPQIYFRPSIIIGAGGKSSALDGFRRKTLRAKLAIGITANFQNRRSEAEAKVEEIAGLSAIYRQSFFNELAKESAIDLENIVYYKDDTHYFVMTAKKPSLLYRGVLIEDHSDTDKLLTPENIDKKELYQYALDAAKICTNSQFPLDFCLNSRGEPDVAIFDFTYIYQAENACKVVERNGQKLILGLVGDSLLEPFWPTGTGCARGFLSALDAAWMVRSWTISEKNALETLCERESIYRILPQTSPENLKKDFHSYSIDPNSRYCYVNTRSVVPKQISHLYETDLEEFTSAAELQDGKDENLNILPKIYKKPEISASERKMNVEIWLRNRVSRFGVRVISIEDSLIRGEALCALLHFFRPDLMPEYPLPDDLFQGFFKDQWPIYKNQLAFDLIAEAYQLPTVVNGFQSIHQTSEFLNDLIEYISKLKDIFDKSKADKKAAIENRNFSNQNQNQNQSQKQAKFLGTSKFKKSFEEVVEPTSPVIKSFPSEKIHRAPLPLSKTQSFNFKSPQQSNETTFMKKSSIFDCNKQRNLPTRSNSSINFESRRQRLEEADKKKMEALKLVEQLSCLKKDARAAKWEVNKGKIAEKVLKLKNSANPSATATVEDGEESPKIYSSKDGDEFFNHYNMRLYRATVPSVGQRSQELAKKLEPTCAKPKILVQAEKFPEWLTAKALKDKEKEKLDKKSQEALVDSNLLQEQLKSKPKIGKLANTREMEEKIYGSTSRKVREKLVPGCQKKPETSPTSSRRGSEVPNEVDPEVEKKKLATRSLLRRQSQVEEMKELEFLLQKSQELSEDEMNHLIGWTEAFA